MLTAALTVTYFDNDIFCTDFCADRMNMTRFVMTFRTLLRYVRLLFLYCTLSCVRVLRERCFGVAALFYIYIHNCFINLVFGEQAMLMLKALHARCCA